MKNKNILAVATMTFLLSACGGDSDDTSFSNSEDLTEVIACDNSNNATGVNDCGNEGVPSYFTCLQSGDTLVEDYEATQVKIISLSNDTKKVCVVSGSAHLVK